MFSPAGFSDPIAVAVGANISVKPSPSRLFSPIALAEPLVSSQWPHWGAFALNATQPVEYVQMCVIERSLLV